MFHVTVSLGLQFQSPLTCLFGQKYCFSLRLQHASKDINHQFAKYLNVYHGKPTLATKGSFFFFDNAIVSARILLQLSSVHR